MARRSKQLQEEIAASLAAGTPHSEATVADWKKRIADIQRTSRRTGDPAQRAILQSQFEAANAGLRAATRVAAHKPTFVTDTNLSALKEMVVKYGPTFPSHVPAVDAPHLRRTVEAGLVEVTGSSARLTPTGRETVADLLVKEIERERAWHPRVNTFVPVEKRAEVLAREVAAHEAKIDSLEATLAKLH